jgi:hypothetical protein
MASLGVKPVGASQLRGEQNGPLFALNFSAARLSILLKKPYFFFCWYAGPSGGFFGVI